MTGTTTEGPTPERMRRGIRLTTKLALLIGALLLAVATAFSWAAYREMRGSAYATVNGKLISVAEEFARSAASSQAQMFARLDSIAESATIRDYAAHPNADSRTKAQAVLDARVRAGGALAGLQLFDRDRRLLLSAGTPLAGADDPGVADVLGQIAAHGDPVLGDMRIAGDSAGFFFAAPLRYQRQPPGFLVQWQRFQVRGLDRISRLVGAETHLYLGNRSGGDAWTDFARRVPAPPVGAPDSAGLRSYSESARGRMLGIVKALPGTPWVLVVETPRAPVMAKTRFFVERMAVIAGLILAAGLAATILLSRSIARPLRNLAQAAESASAGDFSRRVPVRSGDEIGALSATFNTMAEKLAAAEEERAQQVVRLALSEARYRELFEANPHAMWVYDTETLAFVAVNEAAIRRYGYSRYEFLQMTIKDIRPPEDVPALVADVKRMRTEGGPRSEVWRHRKKNGVIIDVEIVSHAFNFDGRPARLVLAHDLTARREAEETLRATQVRLQRVIGSSAVVIFELGFSSGRTELEWISDNVSAVLGYSLAETKGPTWWSSHVHPDDRLSLGRRPRPDAYRDGSNEYRFCDSGGKYRWIREELRLQRNAIGAVVGAVGAWFDVTAQRDAEVAHRTTEERLRHVVAMSGAVIYHLRIDGTAIAPQWVSENLVRVLGYQTSEALSPAWWFENVQPADRERLIETLGPEMVKEGSREYRFRRKDGEYRWIRDEQHVVRNSAGSAVEVVGIWLDITERRQLEDQFRQAQKMEAVGRLAGGVAHDFNNLLTVIIAECDLAMAARPRLETPFSTEANGTEGMGALSQNEAAAESPLAHIKSAAERAVLLTRQLLAFSRRTLVEPEVLDLNEIVGKVESMLSRLIGEDVDLQLRLGEHPWRTVVDRAQIDQLLMNLVVNARDAMPDGGTIVVSTANVELGSEYAETHIDAPPGRYVMLSVEDTGTGMSDEVRAHVFEPFFTTKAQGKGTGLGLATCYAIAKQFGGHIAVYSEVGVGTTMRVYLPRVETAARAAVLSATAAAPVGTETVLLVEDDAAVRRVATRMLTAQGYKVLTAGDAEQALIVLASHVGALHLLLTDVVLPRIGGRELADRVRILRPDVRILFASGYSDDVMLHHRLRQQEISLLQKPFTRETLARKVREVLDKPADPAQRV